MSIAIYRCPSCSKDGDIHCAPWFGKTNLYRLDLHYITCRECRIIYYDKKVTRYRVGEWDKKSLDYTNDRLRFASVYADVIAFLDEIVRDYKYNGYTFQKFPHSDKDHN